MSEIEENYKEKHVARFIAVLSLYSYGVNKKIPLFEASKKMLNIYNNQDMFESPIILDLFAPDENFLEKLIMLLLEKDTETEEFLKSCLIGKWSFDKLDKVIIAILKFAALELLYNQAIPAKIVIDEYVSLAKCFYDNSETGFVNKIIDTMSIKARPQEMKETIDLVVAQKI